MVMKSYRTAKSGVYHSIIAGAKTVTLFTSCGGLEAKMTREGVAKDWKSVGDDFRKAIAAAKVERERA